MAEAAFQKVGAHVKGMLRAMTSFTRLIWSDEFNHPAGTLPDPSKWTHEIGGHGWGNAEFQTYTADAANACHDGQGNLVILAHSGRRVHVRRLSSKGLFDVTAFSAMLTSVRHP